MLPSAQPPAIYGWTRLGSALNAEDNDIQWEDLARYTDVFYIGATKNGGLLGEADCVQQTSPRRWF